MFKIGRDQKCYQHNRTHNAQIKGADARRDVTGPRCLIVQGARHEEARAEHDLDGEVEEEGVREVSVSRSIPAPTFTRITPIASEEADVLVAWEEELERTAEHCERAVHLNETVVQQTISCARVLRRMRERLRDALREKHGYRQVLLGRVPSRSRE